MNLKPYEQTTGESCLPVCLLIIGATVSQEVEMQLLIDGVKRHKESYALGIAEAFSDCFPYQVSMSIGNKGFCNYLKKLQRSRQVLLNYREITLELIDAAEVPYILYVDSHLFGSYVHAPHFIIVEKRRRSKYKIIDPWTGKKQWITKHLLVQSVNSLREYLNYCPLLMRINQL